MSNYPVAFTLCPISLVSEAIGTTTITTAIATVLVLRPLFLIDPFTVLRLPQSQSLRVNNFWSHTHTHTHTQQPYRMSFDRVTSQENLTRK